MRTPSTHSRPIASSLWGIVLAGGDYSRLAPFVRKLRGDDVAKPFVNFLGTRSMLEHTFARAEKLIAPERLLTVVNRDDLKHPVARRQIAERMKGTVIVQPQSRGSLAEVLLALLYIYRRDPLATVAVFPADHFIVDEDRFVSNVYLACRAVERQPASITALGVPAIQANSGRGYLVAAEEPEKLRGFGVRRVSQFVENPPAAELPALLERRALWNTMTLVFKAIALFDVGARLAPVLHGAMERIGAAVGGHKEARVVAEAYREIDAWDFSETILARLPEKKPESLLALPVEGVLWSDCATPLEIVTVLTKAGYLGRANGLTERDLFALSSDHRGRRKRKNNANDSVLRM
jgi:mannose-1-phosphate guanylyltransferase